MLAVAVRSGLIALCPVAVVGASGRQGTGWCEMAEGGLNKQHSAGHGQYLLTLN